MLLRNPGVTAVAVLALALGTGANSAIFSVVYAVLLRPLPVRDVDRLVTMAMVSEKLHVAGAQPGFAIYAKWRQQGGFHESIAAAAPGTAIFSDQADSTVKFWRVSASFLSTLGVEPVLGRNFLEEEDQPGKARVALVAHGFWRGRLNGERQVLGSTVKVDGQAYSVVGVLPPGFQIDGRPADVYAPIGRSLQSKEYLPVNIYARLKRGVSIQQAQAQIDAARTGDPGPFAWQGRLWMLRDFQVRNVRQSLWVLLGAVGLVLLIACANTATLLLARASARQKELATRAALGADKGRLLRQLLTESGLLALAGGACGVLVALAAVRAVPLLAHEKLPGLLEQTRVDGAVLAFTMAVALITGFLFGTAPAVMALRGDLFGLLRAGAQSGSRGRRRGWKVLAVSETALALVLAIGASLLIQTFFYLRDVAPGFRADGLLTVRMTPPRGKFTSPAQCGAYWQSILAHVRGVPGVQAASFAQALPLTGDNWVGTWPVEGVAFARPQDIPPMWQYFVEKDYFRTMQIPLRRGRFFGERDDLGAPKVAMVNETFVRRFWPGQDAVGKHVGGGKDPLFEIVGVVADVSAEESTKAAPPEIYFHFPQTPTARATLAVRADPRAYGSAGALEPAVRRAIAAADPSPPPLQFAEMQRTISDRIAPHRLSAQLIAVFAGLALVLAAVGIYGVLSFSVAQRTHEIGLRMALGAERIMVLRLIAGEVARLAVCGIGVGLAGALAMTRVMKAMLYGVDASDPVIYAGSAAALLAIAMAAAVAPALRAAWVDPMVSLREE
jgi:putative ABC transport system permease protein